METKIYCIHLQDYATPSYYSGDKAYFGTKDEILSIISILEKAQEGTEWGPHPMYKVVRDYLNGTGDGLGSVFGEENRPIIYEVNIHDRFSGAESNLKCEHKNIWDSTYNMQAESVEYTGFYTTIQMQDKTIPVRVIKPAFKNLVYLYDIDSKIKEYKIKANGNWGHPGIIIEDSTARITSSLYVIEHYYDSEDTMKLDIKQPIKPDYKEFCNDIFGDG